MGIRTAKYTMVAFFVAAIGGFVYVFEPYVVEVAEIRTTGRLETIYASFGLACGEEFISEDGSQDHEGRLHLVVPEGGKAIEQSDAAVPNNGFVITGYRYKTVRKNILNGRLEEVPSRRIDVVSWHVVSPYQVRDGDGGIREVTEPLGWRNEDSHPKFSFSMQPVHGNC